MILATVVTACDLAEPEHRTPVDVAPSWRELPGNGPAVWPAVDWWTGFGSPQLNSLIVSAQAANLDLAAAVARVQQADAQVRIAGAALLPSVQLTPQINSLKESIGSHLNYTAVQASGQISYELDFWGLNRASLAAARQSSEAARYDWQVVALSTVAAVAGSYFQALGLQDRLAVARDNLANAQRILAGLKLQQKAGTASQLDVVQQETVVAGLEAAIPPLEAQLAQATDAVAVLLGKPAEAFQPFAGSLLALTVPVVAPGLPSELLGRRPDVREAEARLVAANANITVARAQFFPNIVLTAQGGVESVPLSRLFTAQAGMFDLTAGLTQPIFEGGRLEGQLALAKAQYKELLENYRKAIISAFSDVEDNLAVSRRAAEQVTKERLAVDKARQSLAMAEQQYHGGTITLLNVLNAETTLFSNQDTLAQARLAEMQSLVNLFKALGGGWQDPSPLEPSATSTVAITPAKVETGR